jgi:hypothetical protein
MYITLFYVENAVKTGENAQKNPQVAPFTAYNQKLCENKKHGIRALFSIVFSIILGQ